MRNIAIVFIALFGVIYSQDISAQKMTSNEKKYIQPDQISFAQNGIFVQMNNQWVPTESIHADAQGIYITDNIRDVFHWICPKCGHNNSVFNKNCQKCGY